jgi:hypothetical protein
MRDLRVMQRISAAACVTLAVAACGDSSSTDVGPEEICHIASCAGLQGYWKFDATPASNGSALTDASGNGRTGTLVTDDDATNKAIIGQQQLALGLDGTVDHVMVPDSPGLDLSGDFTLSAWIHPNTLAVGYQALISKSSSPTRPPSLWLLDDRVEIWFSPGGGQAMSTATLVTGAWQHVAATFEDGADEIRIYIDGTLDSVTNGVTDTPDIGDQPLVFGQRGDSNFYYNGGIDEVMVWNRALTALEIADIYGATD